MLTLECLISMSHRTFCERVLGQEGHAYGTPASVPLWSITMWLFSVPKFQIQIGGHHFVSLKNIQKTVTNQLKVLTVQDLQHCIKLWEQVSVSVWLSKGSTLKETINCFVVNATINNFVESAPLHFRLNLCSQCLIQIIYIVKYNRYHQVITGNIPCTNNLPDWIRQ